MRRAPPERRASRGPTQSQTSSTRPFDIPARRFLKKRRANTARPVASAHESFGRTEYCPNQSQELRTLANLNCPRAEPLRVCSRMVFPELVKGNGPSSVATPVENSL